MANRIITMREELYNALTHQFNTPGEWSHVKSQIGMFRYAFLNASNSAISLYSNILRRGTPST